MKARKISNTTKAIAWMLSNPDRTQVAAANEFGISQSAISSVKMREDFAIEYCTTVPVLVEKVFQAIQVNPTRTSRGLAHSLDMEEKDVRLVMLGLRAKTTRDEALRDLPPKIDPAAEMREKCAKMVEMIGGEHGAAMATAIRGLS